MAADRRDATDGEKMVTIREDVARFLLGEAPLEGVWYGEDNPRRNARYWWRNPLRLSMHPYSTPSETAMPDKNAIIEECAAICDQQARAWRDAHNEGSEILAYEDQALHGVANMIRTLKATPSATRSNVDTGNVRVRANVDTPSATLPLDKITSLTRAFDFDAEHGHTPWVMVCFAPNDWAARDAFAAACGHPAKRGEYVRGESK